MELFSNLRAVNASKYILNSGALILSIMIVIGC